MPLLPSGPRLYENTAVTADHPERFRLEILFTPGTAHDPTKVKGKMLCGDAAAAGRASVATAAIVTFSPFGVRSAYLENS